MEQQSHRGVVGIQNVGNTCYANATLQLLRACTDWDCVCLEYSKAEPTTSSQRILAAYRDINRSLWSAQYPAYVRPLGFFHEIQQAVQGTVYDSFAQGTPNDSHEYLVYLLDQFHMALNVPVPLPPAAAPSPLQVTDPIERMRARAAEGWARYRATNSSPAVDLFFGMMRKTITCGGCRNHTYQWEVFNSLSIPCKGATFMDWIRGETEYETVIDGYSCDACRERHPATFRSALWSLPPHLFVTLRRFEPNGMKNMDSCPYQGEPLQFEYAAEAPQPPTTAYQVRAIVDHHGTHRGGHYTAQWKHPFSQEWWWIDDEKARAMPAPQSSPSNYVFYFKRMHAT